jgi:hypothetical protein
MRILFNKIGNPIKSGLITSAIRNFGNSYNETVRGIIINSRNGIDREIFFQNVARLMPNFKMTRQGPFKGIYYSDGKAIDPNGQIAACWEGIGDNAVKLRGFLDKKRTGSRARVLVEISHSAQEEVATKLWNMFKKLVSLCMGKYTLGLVAASKVLFSVFPEVAQPIDNAEWRNVFKTVDYGDIILLMASEISEWEKRSETNLEHCDPHKISTLPSVYNVMAMKAKTSA